jgi:endonuclease/exonuclease/phosphatase family metal-dependent hydrolase
MKLMIYNIAYGTGAPGTMLENIGTGYRYLRASAHHLELLTSFIRSENPDIVGLLEVDTGSYRTAAINQVESIASGLNHYHQSSVKYAGGSFGRKVPILRKQANAVLTRNPVDQNVFHFFDMGFKRLVIEVEYGGISLFLVHPSLRKRIRQNQLLMLAKLIGDKRCVIVAGDFNALSGNHELREFCDVLGLKSANTAGLPTFPSWRPRKELDFILYSDDITLKEFSIPDARFSDHLPLIVELETI